MYALERGLGQKWLAVIFCICTSIAAFGIGNTVQANSLASIMKETFAVPPLVSGPCYGRAGGAGDARRRALDRP